MRMKQKRCKARRLLGVTAFLMILGVLGAFQFRLLLPLLVVKDSTPDQTHPSSTIEYGHGKGQAAKRRFDATTIFRPQQDGNIDYNDWTTYATLQDPRWIQRPSPMPGSSSSPSLCQNQPPSRILLYASSQLDPNGIGAQLNTYLQALLTALVTNRQLVLLHKHRKSYFGCVAAPNDDDNEEELIEMKEDERDDVANTTTNMSYPGGLSRLVYTPGWLTTDGNQQFTAPLPCGKGTYEWLAVARDNRYQQDIGNYDDYSMKPITCGDEQQNNVSVLVLGGYSLRNYFNKRIVPILSNPAFLTATLASYTDDNKGKNTKVPWLMKHGILENADNSDQNRNNQQQQLQLQQEWTHHVMASLTRAGLIAFQPWIAQSVQAKLLAWIRDEPQAAFWQQKGDSITEDNGSFYVGVHVRRGDKLLVEAKYWVDHFWETHSNISNTDSIIATGKERPNYVPFSAYMQHVVKACQDHGYCKDLATRVHVYVATDDIATVQQEITDLPAEVTEHFRFWFHPDPIAETGSIVGHIREASDCQNRYQRTVAAVLDLLLLTRATVFVGEFNSNWGRLIHTHRAVFARLRSNELGSTRELQVATKVRDVRIVFGPNETGWPR